MESAIFGLVGVIVGSISTIIKNWWLHYIKAREEAKYFSILIVFALDRFVEGCTSVVYDDGLSEGSYGSDGCRSIQVESPNFEPQLLVGEWKCLPVELSYAILDFPNHIRSADGSVSYAFEFNDCPPDHNLGFEERQYLYAQLGCKAIKLADKIRANASLPKNKYGRWNPNLIFNEIIQSIEKSRQKEKASNIAFAEQLSSLATNS